MDANKSIGRTEFMKFFRDDDKLNELTTSDRKEIFSTILQGGCDITKALLEDILVDYSVTNIKILEVKNGKK